MDRTDKAIVAGLVATATTAGVLSYAALAAFADNAQLDEPWWWTKWLWPLALDMPTVLLSMAAWRKRSAGDDAWGARACIVALAAVSTWLQMSVAKGGDVAVLVGHALPPVLLLVSWESVLALQSGGRHDAAEAPPEVDDQVAAPPDVRPAARPAEVAMARPALVAVEPIKPPAPAAAGPATPSSSVADAVAALRTSGTDPTNRAVAKHLGVSPRTVTRWRSDPAVAALFDEKSAAHLLDKPATLARTAACEEAERAPQTLSAPALVDSSVSAGGSL